ncbi:uncharacterized protein G2W53_012335 [Senna tora]|uniref:Uncharacterized protein n=1 Tax=Senna tora TaxID=362788 RepID=A0A834WPP1_9FABA|nr:uncharacterized protein G2W53_012335 [Senna tora]
MFFEALEPADCKLLILEASAQPELLPRQEDKGGSKFSFLAVLKFIFLDPLLSMEAEFPLFKESMQSVSAVADAALAILPAEYRFLVASRFFGVRWKRVINSIIFNPFRIKSLIPETRRHEKPSTESTKLANFGDDEMVTPILPSLELTEASSDDSLATAEDENPENELLDNSELESVMFPSARGSTLLLSSFLNETSGDELVTGNGDFLETVLDHVPSKSDCSATFWPSTTSSPWNVLLGG